MKLKKKNTKGAKSAKATKPEAKPEAVRMVKGAFVAAGTKGTAYVIAKEVAENLLSGGPVTVAWPKYETTGIKPAQIGKAHAAGRPVGNAHDLCPWVSERGQPFRIVRATPDALRKAGLVSRKFRLDGERTITGLVPVKWNTAESVPQYVATLDTKAGRIESRRITTSGVTRNDGLTGKLEPLAAK